MLRYRKEGKAANVQVLAAAALPRQAGLKTVLTAIKEYRQVCLGCPVFFAFPADGESGGLIVYI
jgi:hypothetical protein